MMFLPRPDDTEVSQAAINATSPMFPAPADERDAATPHLPLQPVQPFTGDRAYFHALYFFQKRGHFVGTAADERVLLAQELVADPQAFARRYGIKVSGWLPEYARPDDERRARKTRRATALQRAANDDANRRLTRDEFANANVRDTFVQRLPMRVLSGNHHGLDKKRRRRIAAVTKRYIAVNDATEVRWIGNDMDRPADLEGPWDVKTWWRVCGVPEPNVIVVNPETGNGLYLHALACPVTTRRNGGRRWIVAYLEAVKRGLTRRLRADTGYRGGTVRNPLYERHEAIWADAKAYTLADLAKTLTREEMARTEYAPRTGAGASTGRNSTVFDELRLFGYANVLAYKRDGHGIEKWSDRLATIAHQINDEFPLPLDDCELNEIVRKVADWTWHEYQPHRTTEFQRKAAFEKAKQRGAEIEAVISATANDNMPRANRIEKVMTDLGVSKERARRLVAKPRTEYVNGSISQSKPWIAAKMSRAKWYRHRKRETD